MTASLLLALAVVLIAARLLGAAARRIGQPAVIGEIVAGVLAGPTLLHGAIADTLFPAGIRPALSGLANVGLAVFMFVVGMELDATRRGAGRVTVSVGLASTLLPFGLGALLGWRVSGTLAGAVFLGAAMSVTAFPVLARILTDRNLHNTPIGQTALGSAAVCDVLSWSLLALAATLNGQHAWHVLFIAPYAALLFLAVRPALRALLARFQRTETVLAVALAGTLISGGLTEWMGLHFIFGCFLFGTVMPRDSLHTEAVTAISQPALVLLLPVYFVTAGLRVDLSHLGGADLALLALVLLVAVGGKTLATFAAARAHGLDPRRSTALAALMNTRGLTELAILTAGLELGLLDRKLYSLMVVMAVVTTALTGPVLRLVYPDRLARTDVTVTRDPQLV